MPSQICGRPSTSLPFNSVSRMDHETTLLCFFDDHETKLLATKNRNPVWLFLSLVPPPISMRESHDRKISHLVQSYTRVSESSEGDDIY